MDAERGIHRVMPGEGCGYQVDIAQVRGIGIVADLKGRDFTVNAMAIPLSGIFSDGIDAAGIIDPSGGCGDLVKGVIRAVQKSVVVDDPLRLVRAYRFSASLGFEIEPQTLGIITSESDRIAGVSPERVREELYAILMQDGSAKVFGAMVGAGLLQRIMPECAAMEGIPQSEPHRYDVLGHSLKALEYAEKIMAGTEGWFGPWHDNIEAYLSASVDGGLNMRGLVKLCAFLHDSGKPSKFYVDGNGRVRFIGHDEEGAKINEGIAARLKMSNFVRETLSSATRGHMRPFHMSEDMISGRAFYRFVRDMGAGLPASLVVALADAFATRDEPGTVATDVEGVVLRLAGYYYGDYIPKKAEPLVRGTDLISLGLKPGPIFRTLLEEVEERRADKTIRDRDGALEYLRSRLREVAGS
jgi:poly(A) polymerase